MELPKAYEPQKHENGIYKDWESKKLFKPEVHSKGDPFSIVLPPPNATGTLHLGHATMLAIQDLMVRHQRMNGKAALWVPGTDHAAIATQSKVEKILKKEEGKSRHDLGREAFLERVRAFVADSQDTIRNQVRKMGSSVDWDREAYTLDETRSRAVQDVFIKMFNDGLIYRGHRIVNWDPIGQTTVADDEIEYKQEKAKFYTFTYGPFEIGTARPETKFGDKYVVMHPNDKRYKKYKDGEKIEVEWINGPITATIIKDEAADPDFGTGVMTITPWHSVADFEIAQRHGLDMEQIIDKDGKLLPIAQEFAGMPIEEARDKIVEKLKKKGLLVGIDEDYVHNVALGDRFGGKIEPQVMEQWFIDVNKEALKWKGKKATLKSMMQDMVRSGDVTIIPERFEKTYFHWVDNLRDWCISRQIWWGHRIPVWYHEPKCIPKQGHEGDVVKCKQMIAAIEKPVCEFCDASFKQDPDTLDTWFSSALWSWSTLLDPDKKDLDILEWFKHSPDRKFHPNSVMETGYDILFFWVARMMLMTGYVIGEIPFETVYLHGLVRDMQGRKMSKSLGNGIDPVEMIDKYGADAVRLSLVIGTTPGNDSKLNEEKIASYRNFVNKLWNIARFILMQVENPHLVHEAPKPETISDKWILSRFQKLIASTGEHVEAFRFSPAGENLYAFTWSELADWYVEDAKVEGKKDEILLYLLTNLLKLWHPYMPFVTEVLYKEMGGQDEELIVAEWPEVETSLIDEAAEKEYNTYKGLLLSIRLCRAEYNIPYTESIDFIVEDVSGKKVSSGFEKLLLERGRLSSINEIEDGTNKYPTGVRVETDSGVLVTSIVKDDLEPTFLKRKDKYKEEYEKTKEYINSLEKKLANKEFINNAPEEVVELQKKNMSNAKEKLTAIEQTIEDLNRILS